MQNPVPGGYTQIGFGTDLHRLVQGGGIPLGGVFIPCEYGVMADSDGDVLLHALVDALLGASGLGDIGDHFPASAVEPGAPSGPMLRTAYALVREKGGVVANVDCVIDCETVRLGAWKAAMRQSVADLLGLDPSRVNIKGKTAEGLGPVGEGKAIAAQAIVLVQFTERRSRA